MDVQESVQINRRIPEAELDRRLANTKDVRELRRLGFIKNLYQGDSVAEAIQREGRSTSTGYRWKKRWEDGGIERLMPETSNGRPPKLSEQQIKAFRERVRDLQPCSMSQLEGLLREEFDVSYSRQYLRQKLPALGITNTKPARQTAIEQKTLTHIDWDKNQPTKTTKRNPYNKLVRRRVALWTIDEEFY